MQFSFGIVWHLAIPSPCSTCFGVLGLLTFLVSIICTFLLSSIYGFQSQASGVLPLILDFIRFFLVWYARCVSGQA
jgi:hypothetical protein